MTSKIQWIEHDGRKILFCDFTGCNEEQYMKGLDAMEAELLKQKPGERVLHIVDVTDSHMTKATSDRGKRTVDLLGKAGIVLVTAMVGVTGIKRVIVHAVAEGVYLAKDMDDARTYVASH